MSTGGGGVIELRWPEAVRIVNETLVRGLKARFFGDFSTEVSALRQFLTQRNHLLRQLDAMKTASGAP